MILPENFQVATIVEKLPPAWRDFKNYLKHKRKELKLEDLIVRLRIEEDNLKFKKRSNKNSYESKANVIEDSKGKASTFKGRGRRLSKGTKARNKKARTSASKVLATSTIKRDTRRMNAVVILKRTRRPIHRQS